MKRNKIFRWLYFIILLLPIMFVFIPMINNYQPSVKSESVEIVEYGVNSYAFRDWPYFTSNMPNNTSRPSFALNLKTSGFVEAYKKINSSSYLGNYVGIMFTSSVNAEYFTTYFYEWDDDLGYWYTLEPFNNNVYYYDYENCILHIDQAFVEMNVNFLYFSPCSWCSEDDTICDGFLPFYYQDYIINTEYNSIFYDFSVKMNDSFLFIGNFTEFVSDNIIDLSSNDYVFFAFTYMTYIFVISLLWLLFEFLMFIINFTHKYMERFYE